MLTDESRVRLKALSEPHRWDLAKLLSGAAMCVCELSEATGMPQPLVSHHLSVLMDVGMVERCRCGKSNYYSLLREPIAAAALDLSLLGKGSEDA